MLIKHGDLQAVVVIDGAEINPEETKKKMEEAVKNVKKEEKVVEKIELNN
jgi:hypothetical protein